MVQGQVSWSWSLREKGYTPRKKKTIAQNYRDRGKEGLSGKGQKPVSWLICGFHQGHVCLIHYHCPQQADQAPAAGSLEESCGEQRGLVSVEGEEQWLKECIFAILLKEFSVNLRRHGKISVY